MPNIHINFQILCFVLLKQKERTLCTHSTDSYFSYCFLQTSSQCMSRPVDTGQPGHQHYHIPKSTNMIKNCGSGSSSCVWLKQTSISTCGISYGGSSKQVSGRLNLFPDHRKSSFYRMFKCDMCCYKSLYLSNLKRHRRNHTGELFKCDLCPRLFADKGKLVYHQKGHKGELQCKFCHKQFWSKEGQCRHEKRCSIISTL